MLAVGLSIALFLVWAGVGLAMLTGLRQQDNPLQSMLLAPVMGLATTTLVAFWLNWLGLPVGSFGVGLAIVLLLGSVVVLWRSRPKLPWRSYTPFAGIFLLALWVTGRPMLEFGFDWVSYANDDMANYCLAAQRLLQHGFFEMPSADALATGKDYSLFYWFVHVPGEARFGSELILAWVCSVTGLTTDQAFMPTIMALHLILISATAGLIYQAKQFYGAAFAASALFSLSALNSLGTFFQLIAQVFGLSLLAGCLALLPALFPLRQVSPQPTEPEPLSRKALIRLSPPIVLTSILLAALYVVYPEVLPFLLLSGLSYLLIRLIQRRLWIKPALLVSSLTILLSCAFGNRYMLHLLYFLEIQASAGVGRSKLGFFPYYLIPSGLANLWGFQSISHLAKEPWLSLSILLGGLLLLSVAVGTIYLSRLAHPAVIMTSVMLTVTAILFIRRSDFGLFKIAMFLQPFLLATLVLFWFRLTKRLWARAIPLVLLGAIGLSVQNGYVQLSRGVNDRGTSYTTEVVNPSQAKINSTFRELLKTLPPEPALLMDTTNIVLAKFQALSTQGIATAFQSRNFFAEGSDMSSKGSFSKAAFDLHSKTEPTGNPFTVNLVDETLKQKANFMLIASSGKQDIFNRRSLQFAPTENYKAIPLDQVHDQLIFTHSQLGKHYYLSGVEQVAYYQLESDWFFPGQTEAGIGRHLLLQAVNPSPQSRLVLNMTASLKNDKQNQLPPAEAIGTERQRFDLLGRGSARIFSPPLTPQIIQGHPFLAIDLGVEGKRFPDRRTGLMQLYGQDIPRDQRKLVGFGRDISLISAADYANLNPPSAVKTFPNDLAHPDLEYSGVYEDGWVSEAAFLSLKSARPVPLRIQGMIPRIIKNSNFETELTVLVEGKEISRQLLKRGEFNLELAVSPSPNRQRIDLRFSNLQSLPAPDYRPVAARLKFIGFAENG